MDPKPSEAELKLSNILYAIFQHEITYEEGFEKMVGLIGEEFSEVDSIEAGLSRFGIKQEK